jgi:hypothetical protein
MKNSRPNQPAKKLVTTYAINVWRLLNRIGLKQLKHVHVCSFILTFLTKQVKGRHKSKQ